MKKKFKRFVLLTVLSLSTFNIFSEYLLDSKHKNLEKIFSEKKKKIQINLTKK